MTENRLKCLKKKKSSRKFICDSKLKMLDLIRMLVSWGAWLSPIVRMCIGGIIGLNHQTILPLNCGINKNCDFSKDSSLLLHPAFLLSLCVHVSDRHSSVKSWTLPWHTLAPVPSSPTLSKGLEGQWGLAWLQREEALALQGQEVLLLELLHLQELLLESQLLGSNLLLQDRERPGRRTWDGRHLLLRREWDLCPRNVRCGCLKPLHHPTLTAGSSKPPLSSNTESGMSKTTAVYNSDSGMSETITSSNADTEMSETTVVVQHLRWSLGLSGGSVKRTEHHSFEARWWVEVSLPAMLTQE